jgi:uncharacterized membrane protein YraQ (UPF0718 family)
MNFKTLINHAETGGFELKLDRVILALIVSMIILTLLSPQQGLESLKFMMDSITYIAPFFVLAVGLAASIKASGADKIIVRVFAGHPVKAIMLAAVFGALSPFCSCGVIPLIASMLAAGVPLAPVMAFWIASPIMDPEMFILTSAGISVEFALAKAGFAIALGLFAGFSVLLAQRWEWMRAALSAQILATPSCGVSCEPTRDTGIHWKFWTTPERNQLFRNEFVETALFLGKWLALAFFIESLMVAYISPDWIQRYTGGESLLVVPVAALIGMPSYLNGYAAIPLIGELMEMGMSNGAAMAFMIAGAVSSIPAAIAVFALVKRPVFLFYLFTGLVGAIVSGLVFQTLTT